VNTAMARADLEKGERLRRYFGSGLSLPFMVYQAAQIARRERITVIRARNAYLAGRDCSPCGQEQRRSGRRLLRWRQSHCPAAIKTLLHVQSIPVFPARRVFVEARGSGFLHK